MSTRRNRLAEAERRGRRQLESVLDDIHERRVAKGLRQADISAALVCTRQWISLMELGRVPDLGVIELSRLSAAVGLDVSLRTYPGESVLRDAGQLRLLRRFREAIGDRFAWRIEAGVGIGDQRAFDALLTSAAGSAGIEAYTRLRDVQAQTRSAVSKQEEAGIPVLILVIAGTRANRLAVREAQAVLETTFPLGGRAVLSALRRGILPSANGIVLI